MIKSIVQIVVLGLSKTLKVEDPKMHAVLYTMLMILYLMLCIS